MPFQLTSTSHRHVTLTWLFLLCIHLVASSTSAGDNQDQLPWWKRLRRHLLPYGRQNHQFTPLIMNDFLTPQEAATLLQRYQRLLRDSLHNNERTGKATKSIYRTSQSVRLPPLGDPLVLEVEQRAATAAGNYSHSAVEDFQLACYGPGELYGLHRDDHDHATEAAFRSATVLIYLQAPDAGGGETLFTRRPLEDERELRSKHRLRTQAAAIELFQSYCQRPRRHHFVANPVVGRAVVWHNWYANGTMFARDSTHGACPVSANSLVPKCVIQQWISKPGHEPPLRQETVAAIFPLGADVSFQSQLRENYENLLHEQPVPCWDDVSLQQGQWTSPLCSDGPVSILPKGPYSTVGALRLSSHLRGELTWQSGGLSISFWVRHVEPGTSVLSLGDNVLSIVATQNDSDQVWTMARGVDNATVSQSVGDSSGWLWVSLSLDTSLGANLVVTSDQGGWWQHEALEPLSSCGAQNQTMHLKLLQPTQASPTAFVDASTSESTAFISSKAWSADISFCIVHRSSSLTAQEQRSLRTQVKRYDINS